ncbi:ATP-binding protein [Hyphomicrobium album]|nr:ATP-binding protein [Hyphomicrobium album]
MKKLAIVGASHFVNRMFEACGNFQWAREFLKNSLEAGATKVEFGIEWQAVEKDGVYRRTISDNGAGMARDELLRFFSTLGEGAKRIGGVHDNFGVGAKIASLPWNPEGVVVISYKEGRASMIRIQLDVDAAEYELLEFRSPKGAAYAINPDEVDWGDGVNWGEVSPAWAREHGTTIVLLGSEEAPDTVLGNPKAGEKDIKGLSVYLNSRFWDLNEPEVTVVELRSERKTAWPTSADDRDDARRPNNRRIRGAKYYLADVSAGKGELAHQSILPLDEGRVQAHWYLWEGERPNIHSYAKKPGYIAVKYKDELFELSMHKAHFRWFGIADPQVQQNLTIILEPTLFDPQIAMWGVYPDQSRNRLMFAGNGEKGIGLPLSDWGFDFSDNMPQEIRDAILAARGDGNNTLEDEEYRKRLQDKFGTRWLTTKLVQARDEDKDSKPATPTNETVAIVQRDGEGGGARKVRNKRKSARRIQVIRLRAVEGGNGQGVERQVAVDVPKFRFVGADQFDENWHLASWVPNDPDGPTVLMNSEAPILLETVKHHQEQYPDVFAAEVDKIVRDTYGEVAVCKIAHSQKLIAHVAEEDLDQVYRNEAALTVSLMGLLAEESLLAQRLGKLGRKKNAA